VVGKRPVNKKEEYVGLLARSSAEVQKNLLESIFTFFR